MNIPSNNRDVYYLDADKIRRQGDIDDPKDGVRGVIPERQKY